jgi:Ran GTPase-activating protein (RanGAP) involved in mRNA processing and transport
LKQLRMSWNTISDDGAHQLAAVLPRNTTLEVLDIADNR